MLKQKNKKCAKCNKVFKSLEKHVELKGKTYCPRCSTTVFPTTVK